jgi:ribosomal protein S18 acetylase RimI-like enzyme
MLLRPFQSSDLPTLHEIDEACFPPGVSYSPEELARFIGRRNAKTWVAQEGETIMGFLVGNREPAQVWHIVTIDVLEPWRRQGVGTVLMDAAEDWAAARGLCLIYLETAENNLAAQAFYNKRGYVKYERLERYYGDGTAAWVMVKRLKAEGRRMKTTTRHLATDD